MTGSALRKIWKCFDKLLDYFPLTYSSMSWMGGNFTFAETKWMPTINHTDKPSMCAVSLNKAFILLLKLQDNFEKGFLKVIVLDCIFFLAISCQNPNLTLTRDSKGLFPGYDTPPN